MARVSDLLATGVARKERRPLERLFYNKDFRNIFWQAAAFAGIVLLFYALGSNAARNLAQQNIATGFDYLSRPASFVISDALVPYEPSNSYARALLVGILNTIWVSFLACVIASFLGLVVGIARLSANPLLARLMLVYVEILRNTPLLLQLFFWYAFIIILPPVRESFEPLPHVYLSNGGLFVPSLHWSAAHFLVLAALVAGVVSGVALARWRRRRAIETGSDRPVWPVALAASMGLPIVAALVFRPDLAIDLPELGRFRIAGGAALTPEFTALLVGLSLSASATIAEIVRSGVQSVAKGQWEAGRAIGLPDGRLMRLVILPQAFRVMIPPLTSTYLSTTKNSSLAIAIGYPDLVSVSNTTMNQTGQAIEAIAIFMGVYLCLSLATSAFMNWYNARVALVSR